MKVEYVNHMGGDLSVVNAARVSFNKADQEELVLGINASCIKLPGEGGRDA